MPILINRLKEQRNCLKLFAKGVFSHLINMPYTKFSDRIIHKLLLRITNLINVQISFGIGKIILKFGLKEIVVVAGLN